MPRRPRTPRAPKVRIAKYDLINPNEKPASQPYKLLAEVRKEWHEDTREARIALAWVRNVKPDADGHILLGKCVKAGELQKELVEWDFVILLNKDTWDAKEFSVEKKTALIDHEMCHVGSMEDKNGEPRVDAKGRRVWRVVSHDIEEFNAIVRRHGCYKSDLERFAETLMKKQAPLFGKSGEVETPLLQ